MPVYQVNIQYGKALFILNVDTDLEPLEFQLDIYKITRIAPHRQLFDSLILDCQFWDDGATDGILEKIQNGTTIKLSANCRYVSHP